MSYQEFLNHVGLTNLSFWGIVAFLASIGIEIIPKIKWNPWSSLFNWIGSKFNGKIDENINEKINLVRGEIQVLDKKVDYVQSELSKHIDESEKKSLDDTRRDILEFANSCMNGRKHTQEQFEYIMKKCDIYVKYIDENHIENGVIESAIEEIRYLYKECRRKHSFLVPTPKENDTKLE